MGRKFVGVLLLMVIGAAAIVAAYLLLPYFKDREQKVTSDARKTQGRIVIALDNWIGYFPLRSPEMKAAMRRAGWQLVIEDDNADYPGRMTRLSKGQIDLAVATVDSYLLNAHPLNFPGTIIAVLDTSKGGDSILAKADAVSNLSEVRGKPNLRVAYTPGSPSHYLLKAAATHFNVPELLPTGSRRIETGGSEEALKKLLTGNTDLAVLWEPDVSKALAQPGIVKILGTEETEGLIVDILLVGREFSQDHPERVNLLLKTYFRVLKSYRDQPDLLKRHIREETGLPEAAVLAMLKGVEWANFSQNCERWFGLSAPGVAADEGLVDTIYATGAILVSAGDFSRDPIPDRDPYRLINSAFLEELLTTGMSGFVSSPGTGQAAVRSLEARFAPLDSGGWNALKTVGSLKVDPIVFQSGTTGLDLLSKQIIDKAVERLRHYPLFRVVIKGHTGTRGDPTQNRRLSQERAEAVAKYLEITYNIDPNRLRPVGAGGEQPLPRKPGESKRSWEYRLPRVELLLVREDI
ncbi:MAG: phosphate ABC transporter substrate-binding/OmpA family protein [Desulfobacteraceae bacterium]|nr:phosphate ABC transporter substrate-binding/OmpA family protein [Desulfobacteraceae bacterium]